jgi:hypothetical protein
MSYNTKSGLPTPAGLQDPARWVFVDKEYVPNKVLLLTRHTLSEKDTSKWAESFQYENVARPAVTPQQYLEASNSII